jgi:hypothetical protein
MTRRNRLQRLEVAHLRHLLTEAGAPYGLSADEIMDEATRYFALSLAAQLAELDSQTDEFSGEELATMRALLIREYRLTTIL